MFSLENQTEAIELLREKLSLSSDDASEFATALAQIVPKEFSEDKKQFCQVLIHSIEKVLDYQSEYASLGVDLVLRLAKETGHPPKKIIASIQRNGSKLKLPTLSWVNKNLRIADVLAARPELGQFKSIDKIDSVRRLPKDQLDQVCENGVIVTSTGENIEVASTPAHEVRKAVAEIVKKEKQSALNEEPRAETVPDEPAPSRLQSSGQASSSAYPELSEMQRLHDRLSKKLNAESEAMDEDLIFLFDKIGSDLQTLIARFRGEQEFRTDDSVAVQPAH